MLKPNSYYPKIKDKTILSKVNGSYVGVCVGLLNETEGLGESLGIEESEVLRRVFMEYAKSISLITEKVHGKILGKLCFSLFLQDNGCN